MPGPVALGGRMKKLGLLVLLGVLVSFGIPLVRLATPGGERDPGSLSEALLTGLLVAVATAAIVVLRAKVRSGGQQAGQDLRRARESRSEE